MNCDDRETATGPRCRYKARVKVTYVIKDRHGLLSNLYPGQHQTVRCWQHYVDLETRARRPGATFHIVEAEVIK